VDLSTREKWIAGLAAAAVALLLLDRIALTPFLDRRARIETEKQQLVRQMADARALFDQRKMAAPRWRAMVGREDGQGLKRGSSAAESQLLHAVRRWSEESGLALTSMNPNRLPQKGDLGEIVCLAVGTGPMRAVVQFLGRLQTAAIPVKVNELHLSSRKEGADDLSLQVRVSTLYLAGEAGPQPRASGNSDGEVASVAHGGTPK